MRFHRRAISLAVRAPRFPPLDESTGVSPIISAADSWQNLAVNSNLPMKISAQPSNVPMKNYRLIRLFIFITCLATAAHAQISQRQNYFGKIGNTDFVVNLGSDGRTAEFRYYFNGLESGTGAVGANQTATFSTDRNRQVTVRFQGDTVTGTFNNQAFSAQAEKDYGPLTGIAGVYSGSMFEQPLFGPQTTSFVALVVNPSGKALLFSLTNDGSVTNYGVGTLASNGSVAFNMTSTGSNANGDTYRLTFSPQNDLASGFLTSALFPRNVIGYVLTRTKAATVVNVATRGQVAPNQPMTAGFVVTGGEKTLLIRAVGPTLGAFGVAGANADPELTLYSGQTVLATNDNWGTNANVADIVAASAQVGAFALVAGSRDAVIIVRLQPGAYTASAASRGSASGDALIEVYEITK
jgi:hypothetical protein